MRIPYKRPGIVLLLHRPGSEWAKSASTACLCAGRNNKGHVYFFLQSGCPINVWRRAASAFSPLEHAAHSSLCETRLFRKISLLCQRSTHGDWFLALAILSVQEQLLAHSLGLGKAARDDVLGAFLITSPFCHLKRRLCWLGFAVEIAKSEFLACVCRWAKVAADERVKCKATKVLQQWVGKWVNLFATLESSFKRLWTSLWRF